MKTPACDLYLEDPEAHAAHLETCAGCRELFAELDDAPVAPSLAVNVSALPVAPWEGAAHRSWPLVGGVTLALMAMTFALFMVAGESPLAGLGRVLGAAMPQIGMLVNFFRLTGSAIPNAPAGWQVVIAISFVVVNTLLFLLLRRAPRGIDA